MSPTLRYRPDGGAYETYHTKLDTPPASEVSSRARSPGEASSPTELGLTASAFLGSPEDWASAAPMMGEIQLSQLLVKGVTEPGMRVALHVGRCGGFVTVPDFDPYHLPPAHEAHTGEEKVSHAAGKAWWDDILSIQRQELALRTSDGCLRPEVIPVVLFVGTKANQLLPAAVGYITVCGLNLRSRGKTQYATLNWIGDWRVNRWAPVELEAMCRYLPQAEKIHASFALSKHGSSKGSSSKRTSLAGSWGQGSSRRPSGAGLV